MAQTPQPGANRLSQQVKELQRTVRMMQLQRDREQMSRRRRILGVGIVISLVAHLCLLLFLASMHRGVQGSGSSNQVSYEFAIVTDEQLTEFQSTEFENVQQEHDDFTQLEPAFDPAALAAQSAAPNVELAASGSLPTLAGAGDGQTGVKALAGGGASTSFFGIKSQGTRFAYIVDVSASMGQEGRMRTAMSELRASIESLPDYAHFYIVMFSSQLRVPPQQRGWTRARPSAVRRLTRWLNDLSPQGGTEPAPAFHQVFALDVRPDVIFFMTDGDITTMSADEVGVLNQRGKRVVVNTIAFGDPSSQDLLRQIARDSDGTYQYAPSR